MDRDIAGAQRKADPHIVKQWAAEDYAISVGLLRECPFHGEPYKPRGSARMRNALSGGRVDPFDPSVRVFNGNTRELLAAVERVTGGYREYCPHCRASDEEQLD